MDMKRERNIKLEHMRQADIETGLRRELAQQIEREKEEQLRAEEAAAALARKRRPKTQEEIDQMRAVVCREGSGCITGQQRGDVC